MRLLSVLCLSSIVIAQPPMVADTFDLFDPLGSQFDPVGQVMDWFFASIRPIFVKHKEKSVQQARQIEEDVGCQICKIGSALIQLFNNDFVRQASTDAILGICYEITVVFRPFIHQNPAMCPGLIDDFWKEQIFEALLDEVFSEQTLCTFVLELCETDIWKPIDVSEWVFDRICTKSVEAQSNDYMDKLYQKRAEKKNPKEPIKVVLFTDIHMDYDYKVGANWNCEKIVCCREDSGEPQSDEDKAGFWGSKKCDSGEPMVLNMFDFIAEHIDPAFALWGGDNVAHNIDTMTREGNLDRLRRISNSVYKGLPNTRVYPTMGNHDTFPLGQFKAFKPHQNDFFNSWSSEWDKFIQEPSGIEKFKNYGYYSAYLTHRNGTKIGATPTKIISVNSNFCVAFNFDMLTQFTDPGNFMQWLEAELQELEDQNGQAIMIGHVPNIGMCNRQFSKRWHALIDRYQTVVRFTFAGHYHIQGFNVERDEINHKPIGLNFMIGSVTTWSHMTPSFQVLHLDPDTLIPVDAETYGFDFEKANKDHTPLWNEALKAYEFRTKPKWDRLYSYLDRYSLPDMSPTSVLNYATNMYTNETAAILLRNQARVTKSESEDMSPCDKSCRRMARCAMVANDEDNLSQCLDINRLQLIPTDIPSAIISPWSWGQLLNHDWFEKIDEKK